VIAGVANDPGRKSKRPDGARLEGWFAFRTNPVAGSGIQNILFGVSARDPLTYLTVMAVITLVSLVATLVPARRATRVDPMIALRAE
jgi:hypothetical protein